MGHPFDEAIAVVADGAGRWRATMDRRFWGPRAPHGGYLGALMLAAMGEELGEAAFAPRSLALHYPSAVHEGDAILETVVERRGKRVATVSARLVQQDAAAVLARGVFGLRCGEERLDAAPMPSMEAPASCIRQRATVPVDEQFELRIGIGPGPFRGAREARYGGWGRFAPPRALDAPGLVAMADAWWPAFFPTLESPRQVGLAPTLDLTVHFHETLPRAVPSDDDYLAVEIVCDHIGEGYFAERSSIWAPDGTLLAQSMQHGLRIEPDPER